jgi:hypothetical protein
MVGFTLDSHSRLTPTRRPAWSLVTSCPHGYGFKLNEAVAFLKPAPAQHA